MVNGLGVAQVTVYDFDHWIQGELGCRAPHEDPDDLTTLTQTAQQRPPKEAARTCDQDFRRRYGWGRRQCACLRGVCLASALFHPEHDAPAFISRDRRSLAALERLIKLAH